MELDVMERCAAFFDGRPGDWRSYEGEGRCDHCERNRHSVCVDDLAGAKHCCVATVHAPGKDADAEELAGMVAWQIQLFASPVKARAILAALRAAEKMADAIEVYRYHDSELSAHAYDGAEAFRKATGGGK